MCLITQLSFNKYKILVFSARWSMSIMYNLTDVEWNSKQQALWWNDAHDHNTHHYRPLNDHFFLPYDKPGILLLFENEFKDTLVSCSLGRCSSTLDPLMFSLVICSSFKITTKRKDDVSILFTGKIWPFSLQ